MSDSIQFVIIACLFLVCSVGSITFFIFWTEASYRKLREHNKTLVQEVDRLKRSNAQYRANGRSLVR